jgi:hypothetical protein
MVFVWKYKRIIWMSILGIRDSGQKIVTDNLIFHLDAAQLRSYAGSGTAWTDMGISGSMGGTLFNTPTFSSANGGILTFNGSTQYYQTSVTSSKVDIRNGVVGNPVPISGLTFSSWIRFEQGSTQYRILSVGSTTIGGFDWEIHQGAFNNIGLLLQGGNQGVQSNANYITSSVWVHVGVTLQAANSLSTANVVFYKNGSVFQSTTCTTNAFTPVNTIEIARRYASTFYFTGSIASVQIYKRQLSATEILQNFNADRIRFGL